jgi:ankyrin repeat protein
MATLIPIQEAVRVHSLETVTRLVKEGANLKWKSSNGDTLLHEIAKTGRTDILEFFLQSKRLYIHRKNSDGRNALMVATRYSRFEATRLLVQYGANVQSKDNFGFTPLFYAVISGNSLTTNFLLHKKSKINVKNNYGHTPLMTAMIFNHPIIIKTLLDRGANLIGIEKEIINYSIEQKDYGILENLIHRPYLWNAENREILFDLLTEEMENPEIRNLLEVPWILTFVVKKELFWLKIMEESQFNPFLLDDIKLKILSLPCQLLNPFLQREERASLIKELNQVFSVLLDMRDYLNTTLGPRRSKNILNSFDAVKKGLLNTQITSEFNAAFAKQEGINGRTPEADAQDLNRKRPFEADSLEHSAKKVRTQSESSEFTECLICEDPVGENNPSTSLSRKCERRCKSFCQGCLQNFLNQWGPFPHGSVCPECRSKIDPDLILEFLKEQDSSEELYNKAVLSLLRQVKKLQETNGDHPCSAESCAGRMVTTPKGVECLECQSVSEKCRLCKKIHPRTVNCQAWEAHETEDQEGLRLLLQSSKSADATIRPCPFEGCGAFSERTEGCNYMVCYKCGKDWNWNYGKPESTPIDASMYDALERQY